MLKPNTRLKRAIRAGLPILAAATTLGIAQLIWAANQPVNQVVLGIGASTNAAALFRQDDQERARHHKVFVISGNVDGLYPGGSATLALSLHNPLNTSISVHTVTIVARDANSGCPASFLAAGPNHTPLNTLDTITLSPPIVVPKGKTVAGPNVTITLLPGAPDACQNATFPLHYGGTASQTHQDNGDTGGHGQTGGNGGQ